MNKEWKEEESVEWNEAVSWKRERGRMRQMERRMRSENKREREMIHEKMCGRIYINIRVFCMDNNVFYNIYFQTFFEYVCAGAFCVRVCLCMCVSVTLQACVWVSVCACQCVWLCVYLRVMCVRVCL